MTARSLRLLADREVHVCYAFPSQITDPTLLTRYRDVLSADERHRLARFVFDRDRHRFLVAHALLRTTLSRYAAVPPQEWSFETNAFGKPHLASPEEGLSIRFNLSHTSDMCACAVTMEHDIGLDVEATDRLQDLAVADQVCCVDELAELKRLPPNARRTRFFDYWTLKEAYVKARGLGLSLPLNECCFHVARDGRVTLRLGATVEDDPSRWQFRRLSIYAGYQAAVAIHVAGAEPCSVRLHEVIPLGPSS